jgi:hypothetical protein
MQHYIEKVDAFVEDSIEKLKKRYPIIEKSTITPNKRKAVSESNVEEAGDILGTSLIR